MNKVKNKFVLSVLAIACFSPMAWANNVEKSFSEIAGETINETIKFLTPETPNRIMKIDPQKFKEDMANAKEIEELRREKIRLEIEKYNIKRSEGVAQYEKMKQELYEKELKFKESFEKSMQEREQKRQVEALNLKKEKEENRLMAERKAKYEQEERDNIEKKEKEQKLIAENLRIAKMQEEEKAKRDKHLADLKKAEAEKLSRQEKAEALKQVREEKSEIDALKKKIAEQQILIEKNNKILSGLVDKLNSPELKKEDIKSEKHKIY